MKRPRKYNSEPQQVLCLLEARVDRLGNHFYMVTYRDNESRENYAAFKHLSSAIDFIESNIK